MKEELKREVDKRIENLKLPKLIEKTWFYNFFEFLTDMQYKTDDLNALLDLVFNPQALDNAKNTLIDKFAVKAKNMSYNNSLFFDYIKEKIENSSQDVNEYISEMINFIRAEDNSNVPFVDLMVKFAMLKHPEDVKIDRGNIADFESTENVSTSIKFAGLTLANLHTERENEKDITCTDIRTSKGIKGVRLGSILLSDMFRFAKERNSDAVVYGFNVLVSNTSAQKMYEKFGGKFFKTKEDLENKNFLTSEEYSKSTDVKTGCVIFDNDVVTAIASEKSPQPYTMQEYLKKYRPEEQPNQQA